MTTTLDPRSAAVALVFTGEPGVPAAGAPTGTPARDLTENDLASLVYSRSLGLVAKVVGTPIDPDDPEKGDHVRPDPRKPDPDVVDAIVNELVATGKYAPPEAKTKKARVAAQEEAEAAVAKAADDEAPSPDETADTAEKPEA